MLEGLEGGERPPPRGREGRNVNHSSTSFMEFLLVDRALFKFGAMNNTKGDGPPAVRGEGAG